MRHGRKPGDLRWAISGMRCFDGLPESNTGAFNSDVRIAEFDPRGGEQLTVTATRPEASEGSTLAFDSVALKVDHGNHPVSLSGLQYRARVARNMLFACRGCRSDLSLD